MCAQQQCCAFCKREQYVCLYFWASECVWGVIETHFVDTAAQHSLTSSCWQSLCWKVLESAGYVAPTAVSVMHNSKCIHGLSYPCCSQP